MTLHPSTLFMVTYLISLFQSADSLQCPAFCFCGESNDPIIIKCSLVHVRELDQDIPKEVMELQFLNVSHKVIFQELAKSKTHLSTFVINHCDVKEFAVPGGNIPSLKYLDMSSNKLEHLPINLPDSLNTLILKDNSVVELGAKSLVHLNKLRLLNLKQNKLQSLSYNDLNNDEILFLPKIEEISLDLNKIREITHTFFTGFISLKKITLSGNKLTKINSKYFENLQQLNHLDLSYNHITNIDSDALSGLHNLKYLSISHNKLIELPMQLPMVEWLDVSYNYIRRISSHFTSVMFPIEFFNIGNNPFICDCDILWLKQIYDRREYILKHTNINPEEFIPGCSGPDNVAGKRWNVLEDEDFVCNNNVFSKQPQNDDKTFNPSNLEVQVFSRSDTSVHLEWRLRKISVKIDTVFVHYYKFSQKDTTLKYIEVAMSQRELTIRHLNPETNYIICVIPKTDEHLDITKAVPLSLNHCMEVTTVRTQSENIGGNSSYFGIVFYYVLGMTGAVMFTASIVGLLAMSGDKFIPKGRWISEDVPVIDEPLQHENDDDNESDHDIEKDSFNASNEGVGERKTLHQRRNVKSRIKHTKVGYSVYGRKSKPNKKKD